MLTSVKPQGSLRERVTRALPMNEIYSHQMPNKNAYQIADVLKKYLFRIKIENAFRVFISNADLDSFVSMCVQDRVAWESPH